MSQVAEQLYKVTEKTTRLIGLCAALQEENQSLKLNKQALETEAEDNKGKIQELEEKVKVLKMARSLEATSSDNEGTNEKTLDIKQKISEFVREIDKCIVLLKK